MARTLPTATPAEAAAAVRHLRHEGWSEEKLAEFILPYMPRGGGEAGFPGRQPAPGAAPGAQAGQGPGTRSRADAILLAPDVDQGWLDAHLPAMDRRQMRLVVDELEGRGWPPGRVALAVLPHLLPKLPPDDVQAIVAGLADLGMSDEEIERATKLG
jgi:hypothetical protein